MQGIEMELMIMFTLLTLVMLSEMGNIASSDSVKTMTDGSPTGVPTEASGILTANITTGREKCECAVFNTKTPTEQDKPILTQAPIEVNCDSIGEENCERICSALAKVAEERGPDVLCAQLGHYNQLTASVHSRVCGAQKWKYTGLTSPNEICCHEHKVIDCKDQVQNYVAPFAPPPNQM